MARLSWVLYGAQTPKKMRNFFLEFAIYCPPVPLFDLRIRSFEATRKGPCAGRLLVAGGAGRLSQKPLNHTELSNGLPGIGGKLLVLRF